MLVFGGVYFTNFHVVFFVVSWAQQTGATDLGHLHQERMKLQPLPRPSLRQKAGEGIFAVPQKKSNKDLKSNFSELEFSESFLIFINCDL